jgi:hypothetical protein
LEVTRTPQEVPIALIGEACRRETAVVIEPFDGAQDRET